MVSTQSIDLVVRFAASMTKGQAYLTRSTSEEADSLIIDAEKRTWGPISS